MAMNGVHCSSECGKVLEGLETHDTCCPRGKIRMAMNGVHCSSECGKVSSRDYKHVIHAAPAGVNPADTALPRGKAPAGAACIMCF